MVLLAILLGVVAIGPAVARDIATAQLEDDLLHDKTSPVAGNPLGSVIRTRLRDRASETWRLSTRPSADIRRGTSSALPPASGRALDQKQVSTFPKQVH
ncbi:hypothetical protein, partial [Acidomonas methanolica]|uniref:hypothetical protein n=1 Tax=Acidomonas methanolica TaxID=437 RepID=UPI00211A0E3D